MSDRNNQQDRTGRVGQAINRAIEELEESDCAASPYPTAPFRNGRRGRDVGPAAQSS